MASIMQRNKDQLPVHLSVSFTTSATTHNTLLNKNCGTTSLVRGNAHLSQ